MTIGDIKVEGVEYLQFLDIEIIESAHRHGICKLVFVVDSKLDTKKILSWNKTQIKIKADKEIIFCGIIRQCNLEKRIDGNFLFVTAFSLSSQLDEVRRTMSFQSAKKKFSDILSAVKKNYGAADLTCAKDAVISELVYMENLTDWEFLKELAERHGQILFTNSKSAILKVKDSSIEMQGNNLNVKTRALMQVGYIPLPGGGTGSLSKFEGGSPKNRSDKINIEHGREYRARNKEQIKPTPDNKTISR